MTEHVDEDRDEVGHARGIGYAQMNGAAAAETREGRRRIKQREAMEGQKRVEGTYDHLGIEGPKQ